MRKKRKNELKALFMGTPDIAAACLKALYEKEGVRIIGAVTRPDRQSGRGMKLVFSPVKEFALEHEIPVFQPGTLRDGSFIPVLEELAPDVIFVCAYGNILPHYVIAFPDLGCINAHASLLPKYRGAAPIQRAIMEGEKVTGITAMYMDDGLDTGDMILKLECGIGEDDDLETVHDRLAVLAGEALCRVCDILLRGDELPREPQDSALSTYAKKIEKEDTVIDFSKSADTVVNHIRGLSPSPCAVTRTADGKLLKVAAARTCPAGNWRGQEPLPGTVVSAGDGGIEVQCGRGRVKLLSVIPEGKKRMSAGDFVRGRKVFEGDLLKY
ncbi:MAG: methionyl-tRNA formyltransferase [Clostridia bacterium]|nr:methionyl-tRNA formyltransferase [Clostridia bacterium]